MKTKDIILVEFRNVKLATVKFDGNDLTFT